MSLDEELEQALEQRHLQQRYRQRLTVSSPQQPQLSLKGQSHLAFCSNDYLGLANHPQVVASMQEAASIAGVGSGASHLVCGHNSYHQRLELALAEFTGRERAILFSTGYMANLGVVSALTGRGDNVLEDRLNHASLIDAALLSRAKLLRFRHNDCEHLATQLSSAGGRKLVVVDGVFSMDGDLAPLPDLISLCQVHDACLMVDDAHGFGVLGQFGGGCGEYFQLSQEQLPILVGTLGKAFGTFGAFVVGSEALVETLIQFARSYIYTTALPPAVAAATLTSLTLLQEEQWRREHLKRRIQQFREGAEALGLPLMYSMTPIQPIVLGDDGVVMTVADKIASEGLLITAIRPPTVPEGTARLRITLSAAHSEEHVARLLSVLDSVIPTNLRR